MTRNNTKAKLEGKIIQLGRETYVAQIPIPILGKLGWRGEQEIGFKTQNKDLLIKRLK